MLLPVGGIGGNLLVGRIEIKDLLNRQRIEFIGQHDQQALDRVATLDRTVRLPDMRQPFLGIEQP